jgi:hypothetical protein
MRKRVIYVAFGIAVATAVLVILSFAHASRVADRFMSRVDGDWARRQTLFYPYHTFAEFRGPAWLFYYESRAYPKSPPAGVPIGLLGHAANRCITISLVYGAEKPSSLPNTKTVSRDQMWPSWMKPSSFTLETTRNGLKP